VSSGGWVGTGFFARLARGGGAAAGGVNCVQAAGGWRVAARVGSRAGAGRVARDLGAAAAAAGGRGGVVWGDGGAGKFTRGSRGLFRSRPWRRR